MNKPIQTTNKKDINTHVPWLEYKLVKPARNFNLHLVEKLYAKVR